MHRGFSLPELVLSLAVVGLLFGISVPLLSRSWDRLQVEVATRHLVAAHHRARITAIAHSRVVVLSVSPGQLTIHPRDGAEPLWSAPGPQLHGVSLTDASRSFIFSPVGITLGVSNATLRLGRGSASRTIVVSRLGRVRVLPR